MKSSVLYKKLRNTKRKMKLTELVLKQRTVLNIMYDEKMAGKVSEEDKSKVMDAINTTTQWLDSNQTAEKEEFEEKQKALEAIVLPILQSLGGGAGMPGGGGMPDMSGMGGMGGMGGAGGDAAPEAADDGPKIEEID